MSKFVNNTSPKKRSNGVPFNWYDYLLDSPTAGALSPSNAANRGTTKSSRSNIDGGGKTKKSSRSIIDGDLKPPAKKHANVAALANKCPTKKKRFHFKEDSDSSEDEDENFPARKDTSSGWNPYNQRDDSRITETTSNQPDTEATEDDSTSGEWQDEVSNLLIASYILLKNLLLLTTYLLPQERYLLLTFSDKFGNANRRISTELEKRGYAKSHFQCRRELKRLKNLSNNTYPKSGQEWSKDDQLSLCNIIHAQLNECEDKKNFQINFKEMETILQRPNIDIRNYWSNSLLSYPENIAKQRRIETYADHNALLSIFQRLQSEGKLKLNTENGMGCLEHKYAGFEGGYAKYCVFDGARHFSIMLHQAAAAFSGVYDGKVKKGMHVLHRCGNARCCYPFHLEYGPEKLNANQVSHVGYTFDAHGWKHATRHEKSKDCSICPSRCLTFTTIDNAFPTEPVVPANMPTEWTVGMKCPEGAAIITCQETLQDKIARLEKELEIARAQQDQSSSRRVSFE